MNTHVMSPKPAYPARQTHAAKNDDVFEVLDRILASDGVVSVTP
jgi:multimeric flavodoxin WrbA